MNLIEKFRDWLVTESVTTPGQIKIHRATSGTNAPDSLWWLKAEGGTDLAYNATGESNQTTVVGCYYRDRSAKTVYDTLEALRNSVVNAGCLVIDNYKVIQMPTTLGPFVDSDIDDEDRTVGYIQVTLTTTQ